MHSRSIFNLFLTFWSTVASHVDFHKLVSVCVGELNRCRFADARYLQAPVARMLTRPKMPLYLDKISEVSFLVKHIEKELVIQLFLTLRRHV